MPGLQSSVEGGVVLLSRVILFLVLHRPPGSPLFPYTTLFRSLRGICAVCPCLDLASCADGRSQGRSEEHTSELQSHSELVCRLLLEKKKLNDAPGDTTGSIGFAMISGA